MNTFFVLRMLHYPKWPLLLGLLALATAFCSANAQYITTANDYVAADVFNNGTGLITLYVPGTQPIHYLTYPSQSFLYLQIDSQYYTNNWSNPSIVEPSGKRVTPIYLGGGKTVLLRGALPGTDTIRTTWEPFGPERFMITQDVYPVEFQNSGQIVMRVSLRNFTLLETAAEVQYVLDLEITDSTHSTDAPGITTRTGFAGSSWLDLPLPVPYYITSEYAPCSQTFPGILDAGYTTDDLAPEAMGLIPPSNVVIVDWPTIAQSYAWGFPKVQTPIENDNALLLQWPQMVVKPGFTDELARTSYGTAPCQPMTNGALDMITLHPEHIAWNGTAYVPNRFPVEAVAWNPANHGATALATQSLVNSITGQLSGPIKIITPMTVTNGGYQQTQHIQTWKIIPVDSAFACGSAYATWEDTVETGFLTNCSSDSTYTIDVALSTDTMSSACPIVVDCQQKQDTISPFPIITVLSRSGSFDGSICNARTIEGQASDPRMCALCGVKNVIATSLRNMRFNVVDSSAWKFIVSVIDSMQNGSAAIQAIDGTGSWDTAQYSYCTIPDTRAPEIHWNPVIDSCACFSFTVSDTGAWDRGLDTMALYNLSGVAIDTIIPTGKKIRGLKTATVAGHFLTPPMSTLCLSVLDLAGKRFDTCYVFSPDKVVPSEAGAFALSISPNPSSNIAFVSVEGAPSASVKIYDVLGREVGSFRVAGSYEWNMATLPAGTYIIRAEANGQVISKRVIKE